MLTYPVRLEAGARGLYFVLNFRLHPYFVHTSSEGSGANSIAPSLLKGLNGRELTSVIEQDSLSSA